MRRASGAEFSLSDYALVPLEPNTMQLLTLGLLSAAGPRTREEYIEIYRALLAAGKPTPPKPAQRKGERECWDQ